ncbi:hypothetical protein, partial [uncultured Bradyrhizobium sp.]|uniref:hypothetical protein n=1 Tax=uncultured Bradyrhizobium sp. TaxID=199684 RepID=UPI0026318EB8
MAPPSDDAHEFGIDVLLLIGREPRGRLGHLNRDNQATRSAPVESVHEFGGQWRIEVFVDADP